ncbi:hypothetical protein FJZ36_09605 [Candidatus Poribacteria bacterium]|nr:hypothetical protein [Candidatus Poribacteria bacterium]
MRRIRRRVAVAAFALVIVSLSGCAVVRMVLHGGFRRPGVELTSSRLTSLDWHRADLVFDVRVSNPNSVGIHLASLDYKLSLNGNVAVQGVQDQGIDVDARGESVVQVPVSLAFDDVYRAFASLGNEERSKYAFECGLGFRLPVLGNVRIPLRREGTLPMIKRPALSIDRLDIKRLNLLGAEMALRVRVLNPNAFSALIRRFEYGLRVNGKPWATGLLDDPTAVAELGESVVEIPLKLNTLQIGIAAYQALSKEEPLDYELNGDIDFATSLPELPQAKLPLHLVGRVVPSRNAMTAP